MDNIKNLIKKLLIIETFYTRDSSLIKELYITRKLTFASGQYRNYKTDWPSSELAQDLFSVNTWSTFEYLADITISINDKKLLLIKMTLWDGNAFNGQRTTKRWSANFTCKLDILKYFNTLIESEFTRFAELAYDDQQKAQKLADIERIKIQLIN